MIKFKQVKNILCLGISYCCVSEVSAQQGINLNKSANPEICLGLSSNEQRLACYDNVFHYQSQSDYSAVQNSSNSQNKAPHDLNEMKSVQAPMPSKTPLLDKRWELTDEHQVGLWTLRPYQPVYVLPAFWTSDVNQNPISQNKRNMVYDQHTLDSTEAKFQLSMKTKLRHNLFGNNGDLWLGYTQRSYWQVYNDKDSRPFRATNYEPEMNLVFKTNYDVLGLNWRLFGIGLNHQSNGAAIPYSRGWDRVMMNFGFERDNFVLTVRPWFRVFKKDSDDNPDIIDYMGHGDVTAYYKWGKQSFSLMGRQNVNTGHGAAQFAWDFPLRNNLNGYLQIFHGYGENLIDYNHKATYVGLGVSLIDWY